MTRFTAPRFSQQATAFAFALATTLAILSGVDNLATPSSSGAVLVQAASAPAQG
jgi:hypothetical protein